VRCCYCGSANNWWLRSANSNNGTNFWYVNNNGTSNNNNANNANGVAFGFYKCIRLIEAYILV